VVLIREQAVGEHFDPVGLGHLFDQLNEYLPVFIRLEHGAATRRGVDDVVASAWILNT
jgi:hypothetical protein